MIDFATKKDHLEIIPVWQSGFDDNADDVAEFLAGTDGFCDRLVFREDEKIVAEMNIIRCDLSVEEKRASAVYFYALATLPEYRGRGIMSSMIRFALDKYAADGIGYAMIVPAEEGLVGYYRRFGFEPICGAKIADIPSESIFDFPIQTTKLTPSQLKELRDGRKGNNAVFSVEYIDFALRFCEMTAIKFDGGYAIFEQGDDRVRIIEFDGEVNRMLSAVKGFCSSEIYRVYLPDDSLIGEKVCRGMVCPLGESVKLNKAQIGLIMD